MPMAWRRIAWFASFGAAVLLAVSLRSADYSWPATLGAAFAVWIILPFVISQICAAFGLANANGRVLGSDNLAAKIAEATKGLPPDEALAVGKRIIDESFK